MASFATATRLSARLVSRRVVQDGGIAASRGFRSSTASLAAQNFTMPALSPTMTEGNISTWKVKEGDSFSAGDVLLEIETDKASMDVEAQDDGILMKITQGDNSKGIQVGTRIGVIAEPGDDISQLEIPADEKKPAQESKKETSADKGESKQASTSEKSDTQKQPRKSGEKAPPQKYPYYPSVAHLLKENGLDESAVSEMTPTGPAGRLLKGDVLAYLGTVSADRPEEIMKRFNHNAHLDLSNIKIAAPKELPKKDTSLSAKVQVPEERLVSLSVSLTAVIEAQQKLEKTLGTWIPLSTFLERAAAVANDALPLPSNYKPTANELFNQVLGLDKVGPKASQGRYLPQIAALAPSSFTGVAPKPKAKKVDVIDFLTSSTKTTPLKSRKAPTQPGISTGTNFFSLTVPKDEEKRAQVFLQRMKTVLESKPGNLVL